MSSRNRAEGNDNGEEGIKVAIRMRPLNTKENKASRVWRVLQKYNSVTQTTSGGKPLPERITGRTFFTFDKTFGEKTTTREVYNDVAQGIVESVVNGLNGTIFAYGQTASGKTHTMQGSGTIEDGQGTGGGVVHMAARDIFSKISNDPDRVFLLRVSFIEIYMEEVRDLLVTSGNEKVLQIREDSTRGVFVNATENIVTDFQTLLSTLFAGEKHRAFASTEMNERSSRSHTIFRITVESRKRKDKDSDNNSDDDASATSVSDDYDDDEDGDGAVRISTLNLVDLAGSESVKHTGATGDRLKEGAKINQSLLTLSRVIAALGSPSRTHINFRDSKLTRILQPSLSGNARMAIICCATPSEMYLEETRSTLQFASRAKLVKTRATVNEVIDERSMIKKLQRELAAAKRAADGEVDMSQIRELESEAARAENIAKKVQEKYEKLQASILKGGMFQGSVKNRKRISSIRTPAKDTIAYLSSPSIRGMDRKRRRQSDGFVQHYNPVSSPLLDVTNRNVALATLTPTLERKTKSNETEMVYLQDSGSFQIVLLKEALAAKGDITRDMDQRLNEWEDKAERYEASLNSAQSEIETLKEDHSSTVAQAELLSTEKEALELQRQDILDELKEKSGEKDDAINNALATIESMLKEKEMLEENIESLEDRNEKQAETLQVQEDASNDLCMKNDAVLNQMQIDLDASKEQCEMLQDKCTAIGIIVEKKDADIDANLDSLKSVNAENQKLVGDLDEANERNEALHDQIRDLTSGMNILKSDLCNSEDAVDKLQEEKELAELLASQMSDKEDSALSDVQGLVDQLVTSNERVTQMKSIIEELEHSKAAMESALSQAEISADFAKTQNVTVGKEFDFAQNELAVVTDNLSRLTDDILSGKNIEGYIEIEEIAALAEEFGKMQYEIKESKIENELLKKGKSDLDSLVSEARSTNDAISTDNVALKEKLNLLSTAVTALREDIASRESIAHSLSEEKELAVALAYQMSEAEDSTLSQLQFITAQLQQIQSEAKAKELTNLELMALSRTLEDQLNQAHSDNANKSKENSELDDQLQSLVIITAELKNELTSRTNTADTLSVDKELAEALARHLSEAEDSALTQLRELQDQLQEIGELYLQSYRDSGIVHLARESLVEKLSESKTIVDENLEQAKTDNKIICQQKSELDDQLKSLVTITSELKNELVIRANTADSSTRDKEIAEALACHLSEAEDCALTQLKELQGQLQDMEKELTQKEASFVKLSESKTIVDEILEQAKTDNERICQQKSDFIDQLKSLVIITAELKNELAERNSDLDVLTEEKNLAETLSYQMSEAEDSALTQLRELQGQLQGMEKELAQKETLFVKLSESKANVDENLEQSRAECKESFASNGSLKEELNLLLSTVAKLSNDLAESSDAAETMSKENELSEALASQMSVAEDSALAQAQELAEHVHQLNSEILQKSEMNMQLAYAKEKMEENVHQLSLLLDESKVENKELTETKNVLVEKVEQLSIETSNLNDALRNGDTAAEIFVYEKKRIQGLLNDMTEAKHVASVEAEAIRETLIEAQTGTKEANSELEELQICKTSLEQTLCEAEEQIEDLVHLNKRLNSEVTNITAMKSKLEEDAESKESVLETLTREKDLAEALASQISQMKDCAIQDAHGLSEDLCEAQNNCIELRAENEKLMISKYQDQDLVEKMNLVEERNKSTEVSLNEQYHLVEALKEDNRALSMDLEDNKSKFDASLTESNADTERHTEKLLALEAEIENYAEEIINLEDALENCTTDLSNMSMKYNIEAQKLTDTNRELQLTQSEVEEAKERSEPSSNDEKNEQIQELQQLLVSANAREEEAKNIALATDEELERKEEEYEEAVLYATECEAAVKEWEHKYWSLDARDPVAAGQNTQPILNEMQLLLDEKAELEHRLETALSDSDVLEKDLKKKYEHEQTELLQEADAKMKNLREEVTARQKELEKHKRDARITRKELIAIQEQLKSDQSAAIDADEKVLQLTEQSSNAEETSMQLATELQSLKEEYHSFKEHVRSSKESFKMAAERKLSSAKEELALLRETVHEETLKARSFEEKVQLYEKEVVRLEVEMSSTKQSLINEKEYAVSKLKEEIALAKVELSRAQADIFSLNQDVDHYKATVKKMKKENRSGEKISRFQESLKEYEVSIKEKNGEIQECMHSLASCQDDAEELKISVKELKSKIKLKDERIKNLEAKRLTKEHVAMIKKLKVERRSYKDEGEDLRKRMANMEESASQRTSDDKENHNYQNFEIDFAKLQTKNEALEKKLRKYIAHSDCLTKEMGAIQEMIKETIADSNFEEVNDKDLSAAVVDLCERFHTLEEECNALSDAKSSLQETLTQTKDNLREVAKQKAEIKEDLKATKEEVVALSQKQKEFQEISENVKGSAKDLEDEKNRQVSFLEKENLHILEENKKLKKQVRVFKTQSKAASLTIQDEHTEDLGSILSTLASQDKENIVNGSIKSPFPTTAKVLSKARVGLGSGEGDIDDDNTQECQQS